MSAHSLTCAAAIGVLPFTLQQLPNEQQYLFRLMS